MNSIPSTFHPRILCMGSTRLYVIHPVSLWNGTSSSPSAIAVGFRASQGHTSPSETPPNDVRVFGQMGARPSMSADHSENMCTFRVDPSGFDSDSRKSNEDAMHQQRANMRQAF